MHRLARFSDCIAKFCKETGKPGPCADPNSKRQQRLKGLAAKAKPTPAQSHIQQEKAKHSNDALDALLDNDMPAYNKAAGQRSRLTGLAKTGKRPGGKIEDVTSKDLVKPQAKEKAPKRPSGEIDQNLLRKSMAAHEDGREPSETGLIDLSAAQELEHIQWRLQRERRIPLKDLMRLSVEKTGRNAYPTAKSHQAANALAAKALARVPDSEVQQAKKDRSLPYVDRDWQGNLSYPAYLDNGNPAYAQFLRGRVGAKAK